MIFPLERNPQSTQKYPGVIIMVYIFLGIHPLQVPPDPVILFLGHIHADDLGLGLGEPR